MLFIFLLLHFHEMVRAQLSFCENEAVGIRLCSLVHNYDKAYPLIQPMNLQTTVTVYDIVEFDQDEGTFTLFLDLLTVWNDTRLTLKSDDPTE